MQQGLGVFLVATLFAFCSEKIIFKDTLAGEGLLPL